MKKSSLLIIVFFVILIVIDAKTNIIYGYNKIQLKNPSIITKNKSSDLSFILINNSKNETFVDKIEIIVKDYEKNIICKKMIDVKQFINNEKYIKISEKINYDLSNAYSIDYNVY